MSRGNKIHLTLFSGCALIALLISFFAVSEEAMHKVVIYLSYPSLVATFLFFGISLFWFHKKEVSLRSFFPKQKSAWVAVGMVTLLLFLFEPFQFKIVNDELVLSATAEMMHFDRLAGVPRIANDHSGAYLLLDSILDKRPIVFPFVLSLVHDFTGFRYANVFFLNALLTFILVDLLYILGARLSGHRSGLLTVAMAGTLPLLSIFSTSGHFEVMNLVMLCLVMMLGYHYIRMPNDYRLTPLVFALIILSQVRYENSLYIVPFGILILLGWRKAGRPILPWPVIISPLFFILFTINYRLILDEDNKAFQAGPNGRDATFSVSYAKDNLVSAGDYFFSIGQTGSNSYLLSVLGFGSLFFFLWYGLCRGKWMSGKDPRGTIMFFYLLSVALFSLVIVFFNFGLLNTYITNRLSFPFQLLFILLIPFILHRYRNHYVTSMVIFGLLCGVGAIYVMNGDEIIRTGIQFSIALISICGLLYWISKRFKNPVFAFLLVPISYIVTIGMPVGHLHLYSEKYEQNTIIELELKFLEDRKDKEKIFWVSGTPYAALFHRINTAPISRALANPVLIKNYLADKNCDAIYISRNFKILEDGTYVLASEDNYIDTDIYKLETEFERITKIGLLMRIEKLVEIIPPATNEEKPGGTAGDPDQEPKDAN